MATVKVLTVTDGGWQGCLAANDVLIHYDIQVRPFTIPKSLTSKITSKFSFGFESQADFGNRFQGPPSQASSVVSSGCNIRSQATGLRFRHAAGRETSHALFDWSGIPLLCAAAL